MILLYSYLGHSGDTVVISNLQSKTKSGNKYRENIYKGNLIQDYLKVIYLWEYQIGYPNTESFIKLIHGTMDVLLLCNFLLQLNINGSSS